MGGLEHNMAYVTGPLQMAAGAALTATGAGAPIGIPLMVAGAGETIGKAAGGSQGAGMGEMFGGMAGGLGEGGFGLAGMGPLAGSLSAAPGLQAVAQDPNVSAIGAETVNLPGGGTMDLPPLAGGQQPLMGESAASLMSQDYPLATRLDAIPGYTGASSFGLGATGPPSGGSSFMNTLEQGAASGAIQSAMKPPSPTPPPQPASSPGFKGPLAQSPMAPKGPTPVQPAVTQVPQPPSLPSAQQQYYQRLIAKPWFIGGNE